MSLNVQIQAYKDQICLFKNQRLLEELPFRFENCHQLPQNGSWLEMYDLNC